MGATSSHLILYPTTTQIININRVQLSKTGEDFIEPDNLRLKDAVDTVLISIREPVYGVEMFPSLAEKAAALSWRIAGGHIFWEGNKRTGMMAGLFLLKINGVIPSIEQSKIIEIGEKVGTYKLCGYTREELTEWYKFHVCSL